MAGSGKYFLGFDFSTQQIKVLAVDEELKVVLEEHVKFDTDLPEFGTHGGAQMHEDHVTVTCQTIMWVKALDMLLEKMKQSGFDFSRVAALSGDGQQCGSIYWKRGAQDVLKHLQPGKPMHTQLEGCFSIPDSPIWLDTSTTQQCRQLEATVGGPEQLAAITGSRGFLRMTGLEILKMTQINMDGYNNTERISLVSSFAASLFIGDYAPIDLSDGSSMSLLDIRSKGWSDICLNACGPDLASKLGEPVPTNQVIGTVSSYLVSTYQFPAGCKVVAFTGDNCATLAGLAPREGDLIMSMGTSDCLLAWLREANPGIFGHIFINPVDPNVFMGMVGFRNGSLTRERIMEECAGGSWEKFEEMLQTTKQGNSGNIGIYLDVIEIQPMVSGVYRFNKDNSKVDSFPPETEVRAVLEGQFLARLMYAKLLGLQIGPDTRVIATGGASANHAILQVIADVFNRSVYTTDVPNSAALGGCYRAKQAWHGDGVPFSEVVKNHPEPVCAARHTPDCEKVYEDMMTRYRDLEKQIIAEFEAK